MPVTLENKVLIYNVNPTEIEMLLDPVNNRPHLFPIQYHDLWNMYQTAKASYWVPEEIDFTADIRDWDNNLKSDEKTFLELNFAFFSCFDQIVIKNLEDDFMAQITIPEVKMFYRFQSMIEDIHVHTYSLFPDMFVKDLKRKAYLENAIANIPAIKKMSEWASKWMSTDFMHRLAAFVIVEGLFFSGAFASIFFMKKKGLMPGLCQSNELIARDEGMHRDFGMLLYSMLKVKLSNEEFIQMINEAVALTVEFNTESISVDMIGMNGKLMKQYIQFVADSIAVGYKVGELVIPGMIGCRIYNESNPFPWMSMSNLQGVTNFFDNKVSQYAKTSVLTKPEENTVTFGTDF